MGGSVSKPICGKKPPMITSTETEVSFDLILKNPGPRGARVQIGFMQKDARQGWTIAEFNKGKKAATAPKVDNSGRSIRKPGMPPTGKNGRKPAINLKSAKKAPPKKPKRLGAPITGKAPPKDPYSANDVRKDVGYSL